MKKNEEKSAMGKRGRGRGRGRPRKIVQTMVDGSASSASLKLRENDTLIPKKRGRENQTEKEGEYFVSDLVWGKVRSHPWWPGQILEPSSASDNMMKYFKKDSYLIAYFAVQSFAWIDASNILPFGLYFQEMEKQRGDGTFKIAVDAALDDVSRRVECGLACRCLPERVVDRVKNGQVVNSEGIQVQCSRIYYDGAAASFVPAELVAYLKSLAETLKAAVSSRLQFTAVRAQLLAFIRWRKGCSEVPLIDKFASSLESFDGVTEVLPAFEKDDAVTVKGNSLTKETSYKRKHPAGEKKKQCILRNEESVGEGADVAEIVSTEKTLIAHSFNITEMASMINRGRRDEDDEIVSSLHPVLVNVKGYSVKHETAPLFEKILKKHGDIGRNYKVKCPAARGRLVEMMCSVYQKLEDTNMIDITDVELEGMIETVNLLQIQKFDVEWLRERLEDIRDTKTRIKEHSLLKKEKAEKAEAVTKKAKEVDEYSKKLSTAIAELDVLNAELAKVNEKNDNLKKKGNAYWNKSLVDGLV